MAERKLEVVYRRVDALVPSARNSRTHAEAQIAQIAGSIREFGFTNPVLIDEDNGIIAGHGRVLAAPRLNLDEVPCIVLAGLSDTQKRAYMLADNKLGLNASWDTELLALELQALEALAFEMPVIGFTPDELKRFTDDFCKQAPESGASEINPDEYTFAHSCPRCGFGFNDEPDKK